MNSLGNIKNYCEQNLFPHIGDITSLDEILVVIGGSVSYGFADEYSDIDVYLIGELPREELLKKLHQYFFRHINIEQSRVQIIPIIQKSSCSSLFTILHEEYDKLKDCEMNSLYDIQHYIPIHDPKNIVSKSKVSISNLENDFWREKCIDLCAKHVDTLEAFYSSLKRGNVITGSMYFGDALKGLLQIAYLSAGSPYPTAKWIYRGLEEVDNEVFIAINQIFEHGFPRTCTDLESSIYSITEVVTNRLKEKGTVPSYIIDDMLSP